MLPKRFYLPAFLPSIPTLHALDYANCANNYWRSSTGKATASNCGMFANTNDGNEMRGRIKDLQNLPPCLVRSTQWRTNNKSASFRVTKGKLQLYLPQFVICDRNYDTLPVFNFISLPLGDPERAMMKLSPDVGGMRVKLAGSWF